MLMRPGHRLSLNTISGDSRYTISERVASIETFHPIFHPVSIFHPGESIQLEYNLATKITTKMLYYYLHDPIV